MPLKAATMFGDSIITGTVPFLAKGKDEMHNEVKICRAAIAFLDKRADSDAAETCDDTLGEIMRCLRVLTMISDPYCMLWPHVVDAFEPTLIYSQTPPGGSCTPSMLPGSRRPSQCIEIFEGKDFQDALEEALLLQQVVQSMPVFLAECKKKIYGDIRLNFEEEFKKRVRNIFTAKNDFSEHCLVWPWLLGGPY